MKWRKRDQRDQARPERDQKGARPRDQRDLPPTGEERDRSRSDRSRATNDFGRAHPSEKDLQIPADLSYWVRLVPAVVTGWPVCIDVEGFHHHGAIKAVRIQPGGGCRLRFVDGAEATLPAGLSSSGSHR